MSKPSVAQICLATSWGGLEMSSVKMTRLFGESGYPSFEICQPGSPIQSALQEQGLAAVPIAGGGYLRPSSSLAIRRELIRRRVDVVFVHYLKDLWLLRPALIGLPHVRVYGFARMFLKGVNKNDFGHRLIYDRVAKLIALSHPQRDELVKCLPVPPERFVVIPNGVDVERFQPRPRREDLRAEWGVGPDDVLIGLIGRLDRQKGSLEFVEAAGLLAAAHPRARFLMVGENTKDGGENEFDRLVRARVKDLGLTQRVILTPFRRDVPAVLNALDVFAMPSYEENFGNVLLEALAAGLPCVGTNSGGTPEILDGGRTGLLCTPESATDLARAFGELLASPDLRRSLSTGARAKALAEYKMSVVFDRIRRLADP